MARSNPVLTAGLFQLQIAALRSKWTFDAIEEELSTTAAKEITDRATESARSQGSTQEKAAREGLIRHEGRAVRFGGKPWAMGAEFGAIQYSQFLPWRGADYDAGYFLYPAVREVEEELLQAWQDKIDDKALR